MDALRIFQHQNWRRLIDIRFTPKHELLAPFFMAVMDVRYYSNTFEGIPNISSSKLVEIVRYPFHAIDRYPFHAIDRYPFHGLDRRGTCRSGCVLPRESA